MPTEIIPNVEGNDNETIDRRCTLPRERGREEQGPVVLLAAHEVLTDEIETRQFDHENEKL